MLPSADPAAQVMPGPHALDDLELVRQGVPELTGSGDPALAGPLVVALPSDLAGIDTVQLLEAEGVPIARLPVHTDTTTGLPVAGGDPVFLSARPHRPFESWHRAVQDVENTEVTVLFDRPVEVEDLAAHLAGRASVLLLVAVSVEREGAVESFAVQLCRQARHLAVQLQEPPYAVGRVELVIVPVAGDHPQRAQRQAACATAYSGGGEVVDLTGPAPGTSIPSGPGAVLFFTGLSGSGKSTLAKAVRNRLLERTERTLTLLDGDVVRRNLSAGLGFGVADRELNIRRIGWVAARIAEHGGLAICSPIAPFESTRRDVRAMVSRAGGRFFLVHVATPLAECERRDRKGLYARARRGEIPDFTGISSPYEEPTDADLTLDTTGRDVADLVDQLLQAGSHGGLWDLPPDDRAR